MTENKYPISHVERTSKIIVILRCEINSDGFPISVSSVGQNLYYFPNDILHLNSLKKIKLINLLKIGSSIFTSFIT